MTLESQHIRLLLGAVERRDTRKPRPSKKETALVLGAMWTTLFIALVILACA